MEVAEQKKLKVPKLRFREFIHPWETDALKRLTKYVDYRGKAPQKSDEGVFLVTAKNIKKGYIDYEKSAEYVPRELYAAIMSKGLPEVGDIVFTTEAPMGNVAQLDRSDIALAQRVIKFRSNGKISNNYLLHYMLANPFQADISRKAIGTTVQGISGGDLHRCLVRFPSLPEQQKIAGFLSAVDEKLKHLNRKKELLQQYKKGVMQKLFSQELRFKREDGSDYEDWEEKRLGDICVKKSTTLAANSIVENNGQYKVYGASGVAALVDFFMEEEPYIAVIKDGAGVGRTVLCEGNSSALGTLQVIQQNDNSILVFLYYVIQNLDFTKYITGSTIPHVYFKDYANELITAPSLEEQQKIADFLSSLDEKIDAVSAQIELTQQFKKGLLQEMFV